MSGDKEYLLGRLTETHSAIQTILKGVDLDLRVYVDTDWRIRDLIGHIATWDREVTKSIRAFSNGTEYVIPDMDGDETDFNADAVIEHRKLSTQQVVAEWKKNREDFKAAISDIPTEKFPGDLVYPWGDERGSITRMVEYMIEHDEEHADEIVKAVQAAQTE